ncbi:MAG: hypothetical protein U1E63_11295 [Burkholderiales bacterium]
MRQPGARSSRHRVHVIDQTIAVEVTTPSPITVRHLGALFLVESSPVRDLAADDVGDEAAEEEEPPALLAAMKMSAARASRLAFATPSAVWRCASRP